MRAQLLSQRLRYVVMAAITVGTLLGMAFMTRAPTRLVSVNRANLLSIQLPLNQSVLVTPPVPPAPKISVLVIWEGGFPYSALVQFFNSFRANAPLVELVWIGIRKDEEDTCLDISLYTPVRDADSNIRSVCLTRREYWTAHRDYFCPLWKCTDLEREEVLNIFLERNDLDHNKSLYRIWRGYIFRNYVNPGVSWWGWADVDTHMGSFESLFPWDVATDYDVIIPGHPDTLLYVRGHLGFIQTRPETENKMNLYENMRSLHGFIYHHKYAWWCAEEAEFSAFVSRHPLIDFLILPHHLSEVASWQPKTATISTLLGTYKMSLPAGEGADAVQAFPRFPVLSLPARPSSFVPTFSSAGTARPIALHIGQHGQSWVPDEFVTHYDPDWSLADGPVLRFLGRGGGMKGGPEGVWERIEPVRPTVRVSATRDAAVHAELEEGLYVHWFHLKHDHHKLFNSLPMEPLGSTQAIVEFSEGGIEIWDTELGDVVWRGQETPPTPLERRTHMRRAARAESVRA